MADRNVRFPLRVHTDEEDFVIEMDEEGRGSPLSPDGDKVRLKRRRRCGQCGPCQVKENCAKCHFCLRKDVLKQTCIYRKCVYLRSKPKPYTRPKPSPQQPSQVLSSLSSTLSSPLSSSLSTASSPPQHIPPMMRSPPLSAGNMSFPDGPLTGNRPENPFLQHQISDQQAAMAFHHGYPQMESNLRTTFPHAPLGMNPHCRMPTPHSPVTDQSMMVPQPQTSMSSHTGISERTLNDLRHSQTLQMQHHAYRDSSQMMGDGRIPGYNMSHMGDMRDMRPGSSSSACMYPPTMPHSMPGPFDRSPRPPFFPNGPDMLSSQFLSSLPPGYPFPPGRFPDGFPGGSFPALGMPPAPNMAACAVQGTSQPFPQQYTSYNQSNSGCPKNGCCPPASPNTDTDARVMQEKYGYDARKMQEKYGYDAHMMQEKYGNLFRSYNMPTFQPFCPLELFQQFRCRRPTSALSMDDLNSSASSDFECDIISIDDFQMSAYIRSDGCNSIEIEIDDKSVIDDSHDGSMFNTPGSKVGSKTDKSSPRTKERTPKKGEETPEEEVMAIKDKKSTVCGTVCLKQDLGEEGILQLEIPGIKVTIEDTILDSALAKYSCNLDELLDFIQKEPKIEYLDSRGS